jgi:site-specific recombinase XerD
MRRKEFTLQFLIENFFTEYLTQQKKVSRHTASSYRDTFRLLLKYVSEGRGKPIATITIEDLQVDCILSFLNHLENSRKCGARSRNQRLAAIKSFFKHANVVLPDKSNLIHRVLSLSNKQTEKVLIDFLTPEESTALLAAPDRFTWIGRRDHMLILFAVETGLRVSELLNVKVGDVNLDHHPSVYCMGKGRKERRTPLGKASVLAMREWLKELRNENFVFTTQTGKPMTADAVQALLKKYQALAQESCPSLKNKRLSPHVLRHTTAMTLLLSGVDITVIALWLGHSSTDTTLKEYIKASIEIKEKALKKAAPTNTPFRRYQPSQDILAFLESI